MRRVRAQLPANDIALTRRQRQVAELIVDQRLTSIQAARRLGLAPSTIDTHINAIDARLRRAAAPEQP
jgi:DNA-binding CsgD family transcriptional regulator